MVSMGALPPPITQTSLHQLPLQPFMPNTTTPTPPTTSTLNNSNTNSTLYNALLTNGSSTPTNNNTSTLLCSTGDYMMNTQTNEDISTIFVVGFPEDMQEREFQNMFIFSPGFEAATLKIPSKDLEDDLPTTTTTTTTTTTSTSNNNNMNSGRKQIIGFAKFHSRSEALEARDTLSGRKVDAEKGSVLKAEMAKKNLHTKRGLSSEQQKQQQQQQHAGVVVPTHTPAIVAAAAAAAAAASVGGGNNNNNNGGTGAGMGGGGMGGNNNNGGGIVIPPPPPSQQQQQQQQPSSGVVPVPTQSYPQPQQKRYPTTPYEAFYSVPLPVTSPEHHPLDFGFPDNPQQQHQRPSSTDRAASMGDIYSLTNNTTNGNNNNGNTNGNHINGNGNGRPSFFNHRYSLFDMDTTATSPPLPPLHIGNNGNNIMVENIMCQSISSSQQHSLVTSPTTAPAPLSSVLEEVYQQQPSPPLPQPSLSASSTSHHFHSHHPNYHPNYHHHPSDLSAALNARLNGLSINTTSPVVSNGGLPSPPGVTSPTHYRSLFGTMGTTTTANTINNNSNISHCVNGINGNGGGPISTLSTTTTISSSMDQNNPPCNTLYVGNLPPNTNEEELRMMFAKCIGFKRLSFKSKANNGPMCFVEFEDVACATQALHELYGNPLSNSVKGGIRLSFSKNPLGVRQPSFPGMYRRESLSMFDV
ncbi:hypothetical protein BDA99DRAFT_534409 [Phascolomyces articulosus]|uniref:RRM domain-containing protein n=1 Tax=Phascolomyces articulosus TaxID=60185 RepID=A0AAD5K7E2_9FUNG|nr:hypothetical protein BDA99DRAFT_534409 [Phascolomyces articulosus]